VRSPNTAHQGDVFRYAFARFCSYFTFYLLNYKSKTPLKRRVVRKNEVGKVSKVILEGFIEVPENDLELVRVELPNHIKLTRNENGCMIFDVNQDQENKCRFNVYEEFVNQESFDFHQKRVKLSRWGEITKNVKRNYNIKS